MKADDVIPRLQADLTARFPDWGFSVRLRGRESIELHVLGRRHYETSDDDVAAISEILLRYRPYHEICWPPTIIGPKGTPFAKWLGENGFNVE